MAKNPKADFQKIIAKLESELKNETKKAIKEVASQVIDRMKGLISKGISPIKGKGRFPAYKANAATRGKKGAVKRGYPYNQKNKHPSKKVTPVNLELSGEFLSNLESKVTQANGKYSAEIGFFDQESIKKESGHREGVNSQPQRPVIPQGSEKISAVIEQEVLKQLEAAVTTASKKADKA